MEWNVKNAVNRDVERQHLNKILKEIRQTLDTVETTTSQNVTQVQRIVQQQGGGSSSPSPPRSITVTLTGDVSGTGKGTSAITVPVSLASDVVRDAPLDSNPYWRINGDWEIVPDQVKWFDTLDQSGIVVFDYDNEVYVAREIVGDVDWIDVTDGNGVADNPTLTLNERAKAGFSRIVTLAATTIHGGRAVVVEDGESRHPTLTDVGDSVKIAGMAMNSAMLGEEVEVQTGGVTNDNSWTWVAGPVFVDEDGVLVQPAPVTGYVVSIGRATDSTTIDIDVGTPLIRS